MASLKKRKFRKNGHEKVDDWVILNVIVYSNNIFSFCNAAKGIKNSIRENYLLDLTFSIIKAVFKETVENSKFV